MPWRADGCGLHFRSGVPYRGERALLRVAGPSDPAASSACLWLPDPCDAAGTTSKCNCWVPRRMCRDTLWPATACFSMAAKSSRLRNRVPFQAMIASPGSIPAFSAGPEALTFTTCGHASPSSISSALAAIMTPMLADAAGLGDKISASTGGSEASAGLTACSGLGEATSTADAEFAACA